MGAKIFVETNEIGRQQGSCRFEALAIHHKKNDGAALTNRRQVALVDNFLLDSVFAMQETGHQKKFVALHSIIVGRAAHKRLLTVKAARIEEVILYELDIIIKQVESVGVDWEMTSCSLAFGRLRFLVSQKRHLCMQSND